MAAIAHDLRGTPEALAGPGEATIKQAACSLLPGAERRAVARVADADTLVLDDGRSVRLAGTLAPSGTDAGSSAGHWPPEREALSWLQQITAGRSVLIAKTQSPLDRYGRISAHVFLLERDGSALWLQGAMLAAGHARAYAWPGQAACLDALLQAESPARLDRLGLWGNAAYAVRHAYRSNELLKVRNTFQIVEGRVMRVANVKGRIYLNFGRDWHQDFTVAIGRKLVRSEPDWAAMLGAIEGRRVRVRGWIERRNGPMIVVGHPQDLEIIGGHPQAAPHRAPALGRHGAIRP